MIEQPTLAAAVLHNAKKRGATFDADRSWAAANLLASLLGRRDGFTSARHPQRRNWLSARILFITSSAAFL